MPLQFISKTLRRKIVLYPIAGVAAASVTLILFSHLLIEASARGRTYSTVDEVPHARVGLVLGCSERLADGRQNLFFKYRTQAAAELFKAGKLDYILVSGDNSREGYDEPKDMKNALIRMEVPTDRIHCDFAGFRTLDSVVRAHKVFQEDGFLIISQAFHNKRALFIAEKKGISATAFNAKEVGKNHGTRTKIREIFAKVKTLLDVYLLRTEPRFYGPTQVIPDRQPQP